jgi:hypothetical protein
MGGTELLATTSTRRNSLTKGKRVRSAAADIARAEIEAKVTKSAGEVINPQILIHTSAGTFATTGPVTNNSLCVKRGRLFASEMALRNSTPLAWQPNLDEASIPGVNIVLA